MIILGNRSFLALPYISEMKDIFNRRVKFRENFRSFAAAILEEHKYLAHTKMNPYMLIVLKIKSMRKLIPTVSQVDGTVRILTLNKNENTKLYKLQCAIRQITGHCIVLNTPFNVKGEPIIFLPENAIESLAGADVGVLYLGNLKKNK